MTKQPVSPDPTDVVSVCRAGDRSATWALGSLFERLVTADRTGGAVGAAVVTQPPGLARRRTSTPGRPKPGSCSMAR
jgi:hypothetical protein